jgi:pyruvate dehydrogenase E2 component (dihydrolipoamide acetyltransferase)
MEEGVFLEWLKRDGEVVRSGEMLFVLEGEKSAQEVESVDSGILRIPPNAPAPGSAVSVGAVLAYLVEPDEAPPWENAETSAVVADESAPAAPAAVAAPVDRPRVRTEPAISPRARRVAGELGVDWRQVSGSGRTGRIRERDIRAAASHVPHRAAPTDHPGVSIPISPARRFIAERMVAGAHETAPVTLTTKIDATNLVNLRDQFKAAPPGGCVPSYTDIMLKLVASALEEHAALRRSWAGDRFIEAEKIDIGIAVDTEAGLLVPVVRDVPSLGLRELAERTSALIDLARARRLRPEDSQGGIFTLTNLGMFGIDAFTPIINLPQCAILGMGRITLEPAVREGQFVPRSMMVLSLTFDHRIVDGGPAARFLNTVRLYAEHPGPRLIP